MSGISNGGGEFRDYIQTVMALFALALILTLANFIMTVAIRTAKEIYISSWYHCFRCDFYNYFGTYSLPAFLARWSFRNYCSGLVYAFWRWNVIHTKYTWLVILFYSAAN